jgi:adenylate cyclase class IV
MSQSTAQRNLELKVACSTAQFAEIERRLLTLVCNPVHTVHQVDTYFTVDTGRLKLREFRGAESNAVERGELIAYQRIMQAGSRWSNYVVAPIAGDAVQSLLDGLLMTHAVLAIVDKVRTVGIVGHTRVHLDRVEGLGTFVELETVVRQQDDDDAATEHQEVIAALGLAALSSVAGSYSDLVLTQPPSTQ